MSLRLVIETSPHPQRVREMRLEEGEIAIGRGADCDWQIDDPDMFMSRRHCIVTSRGGRLTVTDASRGGTYVDGADTPLGAGNTVEIGHGARLRMGDVVLRVEVEAARAAAAPQAAPRADPFGGDGFFSQRVEPQAPPPPRPASLPEPFETGRPSTPAQLQGARAAPQVGPDDPFLLDSFAPVRPSAQPPAASPAAPPAAAAPDDFRFDDFFGRPDAPAAPSEPPPRDRDDWLSAAPPAATPPAATPPVATPSMPPEESVQTPLSPPPAAPPIREYAPPTTESAPSPQDDLAAAFLRGLGLDPAEGLSADEMEAMGRRFRMLTDGLVQLLRSRAREKNSARVAQTVIGHSDVNPLKFLATIDEMVEALTRPRGKGYLDPDAAIGAAYRDLSDHQMRTWTALQAALRRMIDRFDPALFEAEADKSGKMKALLQGGRGARLWQLYVERYAEIAKAAEDRFLGEVGADFRQAYEGNRRTKDD